MVRRRTGFDWPGRPRRARPRRLRRVAVSLIGGVAGVVVVGVAALWLRLAEGPVDLARFLPRLVSAIEAEIGPDRVRIGGLALVLGAPDDPAPALRLVDVDLRDRSGRPLVFVPAARVAFRPLDLLAGRIRPSSAIVEDASLRLRREADGRFSFDLGAGGSDADPAASDAPAPAVADPAASGPGATPAASAAAGGPAGGLADALDALLGGVGPLARLTEIALPRLRLAYRDAASGRLSSLGRADLRLTREAGGIAAHGSLDPPGGGTIAVRGNLRADGSGALRLDFAALSPQALSALGPGRVDATALDAPLSGRAEVALDSEGRLGSLSGRLTLGAGALRLGAGEVALDHALAEFAWDPVSGRLDLPHVEARGPRGAAAFSGSAHPAGGATDVTLDLRLGRIEIVDPALLPAAVAFDGGALMARVSADPPAVEVAALHLARGPLRLDARGAASRGPGGWSGALSAVGRDIAAADLTALWPLPAAPGARSWIAENLDAGHLDRVDLFARRGPDGDALDLTFAFRDGAARYLHPLPPIEDASGWGRLDLDRFDLVLTGGVVRPPGGGVVDLSGSSMAVPDLSDPLSTAAISVTGGGPIAAILEVLDMEPLGFVGALGLDPRAVAGDARAQAALTLPLIADVGLDQVGVTATAELSDVDLVAPGVEARVTASRLSLAADIDRLTLSGDITLAGAPVALDLTENFAPGPGAPRTEARIVGPITAAQSAAIGAPLGHRVAGVAAADARIAVRADGALDFDVALDLEGTALNGAPLPWRKPAAAAGSARLVGRSDRDGVAFSRIAADAAGLSARGAARLAPGGGLDGAALDLLRVDGVIDAALDLTREDGLWRAALRGPFLDLFALGQGEEAGEGPAAEADPLAFSLAAEIGDLRVTERLALRDAALAASRDARGEVLARIDGRFGANAAAFLGYADRGGARRVRFASDDAGDALRALGVFQRGLGGALEADAAAEPGAPWAGELRIADLSVSDDPGLAAMLERAELSDALDTMRREGLRFDAVRAPFTLDGARLRFAEAVAYGPTIGLSVSGTVDVATDMLDLEGVFSPAYGVNRLLGDLPVIGPLFSGGEGQGLIGFTFAMTGPSGDPEVSVNAFSGLLPGALRQLARPQSDEDAVRSREAWLERLEQIR
jgi:hypothetical protein